MKKFRYNDLVRFSPLIGFLLTICLYFVIHKPFDEGFITQIGKSLWGLLIAFALSALAGGMGEWFRYRLRISEQQPVLSFALGIASLSLLYLLIGMVLGVQAWVAWIILVVFSFLFHKRIWDWIKQIFLESQEIYQQGQSFGKIIGWLCLVILLSTLFIALAPPIKFDALVYHLALPRAYILNKSFAYIPENMFWGMPQTGEMLYTWGMLLAGEQAAACLGWVIGVMALWGILHFAARKFNSMVGWASIAALLSGYTLAASLSWAYIDWFTILFGLGTLIMLDQWIQSSGKKEFILAGMLAGFCLGCKYTAGVIIIAALGVIIWRYLSIDRFIHSQNNFWGIVYPIFRMLLLWGLTVIIITLPWWIKNSIATGNPFYPFLIPGGAMDIFRIKFYQIPASASIWETLLLPFSATFLGVEGAAGFSASIGPLLLGLGIFAWLPQSLQMQNRKHTLQLCLVISVIGLLVWMVGSRFSDYLIQSRVYLVIFPALAILSGVGFNGFSQLRPFGIRMHNIVGALVVLCLSFSALEVTTSMLRTGAINFLANQETEEEYLGDNLGWYYPAVNYLVNLQNEVKVLMLFEPRGHYCLPYCDSDEVLDQWKHDLVLYENTSGVLQAWKDQGYTHILFNRFGSDFMKQSDSRYQAEDWKKLEDLISGLSTAINFGDAYFLYSLTP